MKRTKMIVWVAAVLTTMVGVGVGAALEGSGESGAGRVAEHAPPLCHAAARGDLSAVAQLLKDGADPNGWASWLQPVFPEHLLGAPLHLAAAQGHVAVAEALLAAGAKVDAQHPHGLNRTPLFWAVLADQAELVTLLIAHGADVNAAATRGLMPLHRARGDVARLLLEAGANVQAEADGRPPLFDAIRLNHLDTVRLLLARGAKLDHRAGRQGILGTPLHAAARYGRTAAATLLLAAGAELEARAGRPSNTPLHLAAAGGYADTVRVLLQHGANPQADDPEMSILARAVISGSHETVALLLAAGANPDTGLKAAAERGLPQMLHTLVADGAKLASHAELLHLAARSGHQKALAVLIAQGAAINGLDAAGLTALHLAARRGYGEIVTLLVSKGADANARDPDGATPLHHAVRVGHREAAARLLRGGAEVQAQTREGWTALHQAARQGNLPLAELLLEHGARPEVENSRGNTPLDLAREQQATVGVGAQSDLRRLRQRLER